MFGGAYVMKGQNNIGLIIAAMQKCLWNRRFLGQMITTRFF